MYKEFKHVTYVKDYNKHEQAVWREGTAAKREINSPATIQYPGYDIDGRSNYYP